MGKLEIIIISAIAIIMMFAILHIFFLGRKKVKNKEESSNKEQSTSKEVKVDTNIDKEKKPFQILRKKSQVKINKKALRSGSRNPSITKVFGKDISQGSEDISHINNVAESEEIQKNNERNFGTKTERFGVKEYTLDDESSDKGYKINAPKGSPNRAPIIGDRTNFASHLMISEDGNMSGIVGTGVAKIIDRAEHHSEKIQERTEDMIDSIHRNFMPNIDLIEQNLSQEQNTTKESLKNIDIKTLILADAINNPKGKRNKTH